MQFDTNAVKPAKIRAEKFKSSIQQPIALYPTLATVLGGVSVALFGGQATLGICVAAGVVATLGWGWEYFIKGDSHARRYVERYRQSLIAQRIQAIAALRQDLDRLQLRQGIQQLDLFEGKFVSFNQILLKKLKPEELTFNRYLTMAEQVYLNGLDNLEKVALAISSTSAINIHQLEDNIRANANPDSLQHMQQRRDLYHQQHERAEHLLAENEGALTKLDQVGVQLANTDFANGKATLGMEQAIRELSLLIEHSKDYKSSRC